ncbi:MAG TPA: PTS sugar transporter subunit IIC [Thermoanaerobacterales bacterium]|nr:PTS sugar transporter subunit IIC [Thermoanaerobacterales bacterium]
MEISLWQIIFLSLYAFVAQLDALSLQISLGVPLMAGFVTGLVMGDVSMGLTVGATLQLMVLGVATYGGATVPDFMSAAIIGTAFAIMSGQNVEFALGIALPIGLLLTQLDILARLSNTYFQHKADRYAEEGNPDGVARMNLLGIFPWGLSRAIPVFLGLYFGSDVVKAITAYLPQWLMGGLKVAGGILPAMGIAILMRYLPLRKFYPFMIIGFVMAAFMKVSLIGIALLGFALAAAYLYLKGDLKPQAEGGDIDD